jgi:hypothetical protein
LARRHLECLADYLLVHLLVDLTEHLTRVHGAYKPKAQR